jgi:hypothetical protein
VVQALGCAVPKRRTLKIPGGGELVAKPMRTRNRLTAVGRKPSPECFEVG